MRFRVGVLIGSALVALAGPLVVGAGADDVDDNDGYQIFPFGEQQNEWPHVPIGRLTAYFPSGPPEACTATALYSANGRTAVTAAHCVFKPERGGFATNVWFEPGAYYGSQAAAFPLDPDFPRIWVPPKYQTDQEVGYDVAFFRVWDYDAGVTLSSIVGGLPIWFNQDRDNLINAFGYPGFQWGRNYQMAVHAENAGTASAPGPDHTRYGSDWCVGGSSGGPIVADFTGYSDGSGFWNKVTHVISGADATSCRAAYLGDTAESLFWTAQASET